MVHQPDETVGSSPFRLVVCGIDGTREAFEAARQAARLTAHGGRVVLVAATNVLDAVASRWGPEVIPWDVQETPRRELGQLTEALRARADESLGWARRQIGGGVTVETRVVNGRAFDVLREAAATEGASLIAVGSHGGRRLVEAVVGGVAAILLHDAPASVLLARPPFDPVRFPSRVVAGVDGSEAAMRALETAASLCRVHGGRLEVVVATRDETIDLDGVTRRVAPHRVRVDRRRPVDALVTAAAAADLLVVGSRGLGGMRALGSVSERVAHLAPSSVLVVRL